MTINIGRTPNSLHLDGDVRVCAYFGAVRTVTPVSIPGDGHHPHVCVRFEGGITWDLDPAAVTELARRFPEALAALGHVE